jgi:hypothetical protein
MPTRQELLETFTARLRAYAEEYPTSTEADMSRWADVLIAATPGLHEALIWQEKMRQIWRALVGDRGDGLPVAGPAAALEDGDRV